MQLIDDLKMYARFIWALPRFLTQQMSLEQAQGIVRDRLANREANFLRLIEKGIFGYAKSPYLPLLKSAQVEFSDIRSMVQAQGLEATLSSLRDAGVYIRYEEFKGREPLVRDGLEMPLKASDFDNPFLKRHYETRTSGSTGAGTRVWHELDYLSNGVLPMLMLGRDAHGILHTPGGIWRGVLPEGSGTDYVLNHIKMGNPPLKWFTPLSNQNLRPDLRFRLASLYIHGMARLLGRPIPWPQSVSLDQPELVARWLARTIEEQGGCTFSTSASSTLRICLAAQDLGLNLKGASLMVGGEPLTPAKHQQIRQSGAKCISHYFMAEAGAVAWGCANPAGEVDMHFFKDSLALIQYPRLMPSAETTVNAFVYSTLLPLAPKIMLNVESDDFGIIEQRSCGCPLEEYGFTDHIRRIRSFSKLTGEGVTLVSGEMESIVEKILPQTFGGSMLDYQWVETEDSQGFTRLNLFIHPQVEIQDECQVIRVVLDTLKQGSVAAELAQENWNQAGTLQIKREKPLLTNSGKQMPLFVASRVNRASQPNRNM